MFGYAYAFQAACGLLVLLGFVVALSRLDDCDVDFGPVPVFHSYAAERVRHVNDAPRRERTRSVWTTSTGRLDVSSPSAGRRTPSAFRARKNVVSVRVTVCLLSSARALLSPCPGTFAPVRESAFRSVPEEPRKESVLPRRPERPRRPI